MRWPSLLLVLASCGRVSFDPVSSDRDSALAVVCGAAYQPATGLTSRYRTVGAAVSWYAAEQDCESDSGHLPIIQDASENTWLKSQVIGWIGLTDHQTEGMFRNVNGALPGYVNWSTNEPSNTGGNEDCAAFYQGLEVWNDYPCNGALPYVCECDEAPLLSPAWCVTGQDSSCNTCEDTCPGGTTCSAAQTCTPI